MQAGPFKKEEKPAVDRHAPGCDACMPEGGERCPRSISDTVPTSTPATG